MSDEPTIIFICGPHCSGKTTILKYLCRDHVISEWGSEIGKELFYQRHLNTAEQTAAFEFEVSALEIERDRRLAKSGGVIGIETWHPGNLAYAAMRNPDIMQKLVQQMQTSPLLPRARGIRLSIPAEAIALRTKTFQADPAWAAEFYTRLDQQLDSCLALLGLGERYIYVDANRPLELVLGDVIKAVSAFHLEERDKI